MNSSKNRATPIAIYTLGIVAVLSLVLASPAHAATLTRQLDVGATGADVTALQTFLALDSAIYPEGKITGYFGALTAAAVARFQTRNSISAVGRVGPVTLAALNAQMGGISGPDANAPIISNVSTTASSTGATVHWVTNEPATGVVYYSPSPLAMSESLQGVTILGTPAMTDTALRTTQDVLVAGLQGNTTYYYVIYTKDIAGNIQMTWPSTFKTQ